MRLIDVSKLMYSVAVDDNDRQIFYVPAEEIDNAPTVDAEPVRHGHWEWGSAWYPPTCSVCNLVPLTPGYIGDVNFYERYFKRCPNCGAKMDEVRSNGN